jgi:large subunit ribosomal protein L21
MAKFAVIETGGKQYMASEGSVFKIEKIPDVAEGASIELGNVLLVSDEEDVKVGAPNVAGAKIEATVMKVGRAPKIDVIRYKQKSRYFKKKGHRQPYFEVKINKIDYN